MLASAWTLFFHWPTGGVYSNIVASIIWTGPAWTMAFFSWRHRRCRGAWYCHRVGRHEVAGTTYRVCAAHHKEENHVRAKDRHDVRHPDRMSHGDTV